MHLSIRNKRAYFILHSNFSLFLLYIGKLIFIGLRTALREKSSPFWSERTVKFLLFLNNS
jgi:hypothetical protein